MSDDLGGDEVRPFDVPRRPMVPYYLDEEIPGPNGWHPIWDRLAPYPGPYSSGAMYFGFQCQPMTMRQWTAVFHARDRILARTPIVGVREIAEVSTVWIGLDHRFAMHDGAGDPLVFESMVFGGPLDSELRRYSYWHEALAGHAAMVAETELDLFAVEPLPRRRTLDEAARELGVDLGDDEGGGGE